MSTKATLCRWSVASRRGRSSSTSGSAAGGAQSLELMRQPGVTVEPLLTGERGKPGGLGEIGVVALDDLKFNVQSTEANEAHDVVEADRGAARFPACNRGLGRAGTVGELRLREASPPAGLPDQISAVGTHRAEYIRTVMSTAEVKGRWNSVPERDQ
jgi:hypothetical protein